MLKRRPALIILLLLCFAAARAQRKLQYGFRIGGGLAIQATNNINLLSSSAIRVFNVNLLIRVPLSRLFMLQSGLGIANKGTTNFEDALTTTNKICYAEIPLNIIHKFNMPTLGELIVGGGGYAASALKGRMEYQTPGSFNTNRIAFGNQNDLKKFDAGLNIMTSLELNNQLTFNLNYDLGLSNIASQVLRDTGTKSVYNRVFNIGLGLFF